jgi:hypothetical protein
MDYQAVTPSRSLVVTLEYGAGLAGELEAAAAAADLASARFVGAGAVENAEIGYYDQDEFEYATVSFDEPLGMPVVQGTIAQVEEHPATGGKTAAERTSDAGKTLDAERASEAEEAPDMEETSDMEGTPDMEETHETATRPEADIWGVFARPSGQAIAGEVIEATVFGGQVFVQGYEEPLGREHDDASGMDLLST